ncbi:hypothetical protein [Nocardioides antri]|uniref:DUF3558 domain-containing protein n=1 Tax=Nocardioides antri TaxID=2607659 RepID=A0A5B1LXH9_9ACTN|nr:hypothetical protein [Nocardioides antri]KAA1424287.1 hypothetical protein F0U47_18800 [Nocardioides antri]
MPGSLRWLSFAVVLTALPVAAGVLVLREDAPATAPPPPPAYTGTALDDYDTSTVTLSRGPFCDRIPEEALAEALDGDAATTTTYANGEAADLAPGVRDVAHEYGCHVAGDRGAVVRAWLFAPPVTRSRAQALADEAASRRSCTRPAGAPAYGEPSVALVCPAGSRRWVSFRGLFGDAWLACSLAAPAALAEQELLDRAGRWCVAVAEAAAISD